jgi:hypothetical protein
MAPTESYISSRKESELASPTHVKEKSQYQNFVAKAIKFVVFIGFLI